MKTFLLVLLSLLAGAAAYTAEPVRVTAEPMEFPAGGTTQVSIIFTKRPKEDGVKLPEVPGARWHTNRTEISQSVSSVNGRTERTLSCSLPPLRRRMLCGVSEPLMVSFSGRGPTLLRTLARC